MNESAPSCLYARRKGTSLLSLICIVLLSGVLLLSEDAAAVEMITWQELGYPARFTVEAKREFTEASHDFIIARAAEPFVHSFRDIHAYGKKRAGHFGVLVERLESAEDYHARRWQALQEKGWIAEGRPPLAPPVCAAGAEEESAAAEDDANDAAWRQTVPGAYQPLFEVHYNFTNCISPPEVVEAFARFPSPAPKEQLIHVPRGYITTEADPYETPVAVTVGHRASAESILGTGLLAFAELLPEGETWRVDIPPELYAGDKGRSVAVWPTPPGCRVRYDIRVEKVWRGRTSLARCREAMAEVMGYDPLARDAEVRQQQQQQEQQQEQHHGESVEGKAADSEADNEDL